MVRPTLFYSNRRPEDAAYLEELRGMETLVRDPRYYISRSTLFISGMCQELERGGVADADIRIEMYAGY